MQKTLVVGAMLLGTMTSQALAQDSTTQSQTSQVEDLSTDTVAQATTTDTEAQKLDQITVSADLDPYFERENSTALKGEVDDKLVPFTTNVLNQQVIEDLKADRLDKAYRYIPGLTRSGDTANGFTIRGQTTDLQNLQVDGLPGLTSRFGSPTTANIEKVEVVKGPASVLYGWMDPGGMVNMVTKKAEDRDIRELELSAQTYTGYDGQAFSGNMDLGGRLNEDGTLLYRLIAGAEHEDSFRDYVDNNRMVYLFPSFAWVPDDKRRLDLQLEYLKDDRAADDGIFVLNHDINQRADIDTYYNEPGNYDNDEGYALSAKYNQALRDGVDLNLNWRSVWHEDERDSYEANSVQSDDTLRRRNRHQYNERQYHFADANLDMDLDFVTKQNLIVGLGGGYEYRQYDRLAFDTRGANVDLLNPIYTGDILADDPGNYRNWDLYTLGVYAQDQIFVTDKLSLLFGARYDSQSGDYHLRYVDSDETADESADIQTTAFNTGITYEVLPQTSVYASMSQSFNPQAIPNYDADNNQLDPEKGIQYEAGVKFSMLGDKLNTQFSVYNLTRENVSETVDGAKALVGTVESQGAEVTVQYQPSLNWQFQASYNYMDAEVTETTNDDARGNVPAFAPEHTASLLARYNHPEEVLGGFVGMGLGWRFESARFTDEDSTDRVRLPSYHVTDMNFYYEIDNLKMSLVLENIFDEVYFIGGKSDTEIYAGDPRSITLKAKYIF